MPGRPNVLRILSLLSIVSAPFLHAGPAASQAYPSRDVTIVVPYPAGSNGDTVARLLRMRDAMPSGAMTNEGAACPPPRFGVG